MILRTVIPNGNNAAITKRESVDIAVYVGSPKVHRPAKAQLRQRFIDHGGDFFRIALPGLRNCKNVDREGLFGGEFPAFGGHRGGVGGVVGHLDTNMRERGRILGILGRTIHIGKCGKNI